jgi:hypothetical protein
MSNLEKYYEEYKLLKKLIRLNPEVYAHLRFRMIHIKIEVNSNYGIN